MDFTDSGAQNIPVELTPRLQFTIQRSFAMPTGVMNNIELVIGKHTHCFLILEEFYNVENFIQNSLL